MSESFDFLITGHYHQNYYVRRFLTSIPFDDVASIMREDWCHLCGRKWQLGKEEDVFVLDVASFGVSSLCVCRACLDKIREGTQNFDMKGLPFKGE